MANTVNDALKDLYLACGGDPSKLTDNHDVSDYIKDLASVLNGGGGDSSNIFTVTFTCPDGETFECDKTFNDIHDAVENGKIVMGHYESSNRHYYTFIEGNADDNTTPQFMFVTGRSFESDNPGSVVYGRTMEIISIGSSNVIYHNTINITGVFDGDIW